MIDSKPMKHFLNTRPADRAQPLTLALEQAGWCVSELPLLELVPLPLGEDDQQTLLQLALQPPSVIVVVSPTAARLGLQELAVLNIDAKKLTTRWLAVGHGTAQVLKTAGIISDVPELETSEGLIASAALSDLVSNDSVMVWRGIGGRELVQECLLARGVQLQVINLYRRQLPAFSQESWTNDWINADIVTMPIEQVNKQAKKYDNTKRHVVLLSSGESWRYWRVLAGEAALIPWLLVLGQRLMDEVSALTPRMSRLTSLQPEHILHVLAELENRE